jgi:hypothetical protein
LVIDFEEAVVWDFLEAVGVGDVEGRGWVVGGEACDGVHVIANNKRHKKNKQ